VLNLLEVLIRGGSRSRVVNPKKAAGDDIELEGNKHGNTKHRKNEREK
jgi:hypothetical protein